MRSRQLDMAVGWLHGQGIPFILVHESALMGWSIDNNLFLEAVDVCVPQEVAKEFDGYRNSRYLTVDADGLKLRIWTPKSLGIEKSIEVTASAGYGCDCLAPDLVLETIDLAPNRQYLYEQVARLAAILYVDELSNETLARFRDHVRG